MDILNVRAAPLIVRFDPGAESVLREVGLAAAALGAEAWAVGGAVRDALTGNSVTDLDVSVVGSVRALVRELARRWDAEVEQHDAFTTATLRRRDGLRIDLIRARSEVYETPGALPCVTASGLLDDLRRRDFTVNAIAANLLEEGFGEVVDPHGGVADRAAGVLRILHAASFVDDPTRLFRAARYCVRLGLSLDGMTDRAARQAVAAGALTTVSADRRRREVEMLLTERNWVEAVVWLNGWGVWAALADRWEAPSALLKRIDVVLAWARRVYGAATPAPADMRWVHLVARLPAAAQVALAVKPAERRSLASIHRVIGSLDGPESPAWWRAMDTEPLVVLLSAMALSRNDAEKQRMCRYIERYRGIKLSITGDDLVAAGIPASPQIGVALRQTLDAVRTDRIGGRDEELAFALELVRRRSR